MTTLARQLPHDVEIEQALLGALLVNNEHFARVGDFLKPEHFFSSLHARLYEAIVHLRGERDRDVNPATLRTFFDSDPAFIDAGGIAYLQALVEATPAIVNVLDFARVIVELATRRALVGIGEDIVNTAYVADVTNSPQKQIEAAEKALYGIAEKGKFGGGFLSMREALKAALLSAETAYQRKSQTTGVPTGFRLLDYMLGGLQRSDLIILAGRPGMGKTSLATNIAVNAARARLADPQDGGACAFFSLEMSATQLATRVMAEYAQVPSEKLRTGKMREDEFYSLADAVATIEAMPLHIDDSPGLSIAQVAARARRMKRDREAGLDLVVIDYLQLLEAASRRENRVQEITEITKGLKGLAKELDVPVLALSQLNRGVDNRDDKRPVLSDLRESGSIEQDADVVMFVYREEYYLRTREPDMSDAKKYAEWKEKAERAHGKAEVIIEKHRHGPTGVVTLAFNGELTRFDNLAREEDAAFAA
ncbi:MAG: replicative DNA helicase [Alphaproteobacteria bacterium]|nr:replicative DNA helicase [Alphaproteobacteria bacterium]